MNHLKIFIELTRLNKPIGFMLLFWPCSWGLAYANYYKQNIKSIGLVAGFDDFISDICLSEIGFY